MADPHAREQAVDALHDFYGKGHLRILAGGGISIPSGLPSWDSLNVGLLQSLIRSDASDKNLWAGLIEPELPKLTRALYDILGRNGAADFVRMAKSKNFERTLASRRPLSGRQSRPASTYGGSIPTGGDDRRRAAAHN